MTARWRAHIPIDMKVPDNVRDALMTIRWHLQLQDATASNAARRHLSDLVRAMDGREPKAKKRKAVRT